MPSSNDSARFILAVDPESITIFNWFGNLNFQPSSNTYLNFGTEIYSYATKTFAEAWYKPSYKISLEWIQRYSEKITSQVGLTSLGGIKAPSPVTLVSQRLDPIIDLSLEATYQINERADAFFQLSNLFGKEYEQFLNYPNRGISFKVGAMYRF